MPQVPTKLNLNTATLEELKTLPSVGPCVAQNFLAFRQKHGRFKDFEDVRKINGIGEKNLRKLQDIVVFD